MNFLQLVVKAIRSICFVFVECFSLTFDQEKLIPLQASQHSPHRSFHRLHSLSIAISFIALSLINLKPAQAATPYDMGTPTLQDIWVDPVNGSDSASGNTRAQALRTVGAAWQRIPSNVTLSSTGYRVMLTAGNYPANTLPNYWDLRYGTFTRPIIFQAADGDGTPVFANINMAHCNYVYFIGIKFQTTGGDVVHFEACNHMLLRQCKIQGSKSGTQEALKVNQSQYVYIEDTEISHCYENPIDFVGVQYGHIIKSKMHDGDSWCTYLKGGSANLLVDGNEFYNCGGGGSDGAFLAGQSTGFEFMTSPWIHYEAYDIKFVNNIIHDSSGAGMGVNGGYNILMAYNTLYRVGSRDHGIGVFHGMRSCDNNDNNGCVINSNLGGWGPRNAGGNTESIPNRNIYIYNNVLYNPSGYQSQWSHFVISGSVTPPAGMNIPSPSRADNNVRIRGNVIWNGPATLDINGGSGCNDANCSESQLITDNAINKTSMGTPQLVNPAAGDYTPVAGGNIFSATTYAIPDFASGDQAQPPLAPVGNLSNAVLLDRAGNTRTASGPPGAYIGATSTTPSVVLSSTPTSQNVVVGSSTTYTINMSRNNFTGGVTLSATGLPSNASASFSPTGANTGNSATLTVTTNANTPTGSNTLTVSGTATGLTINPITVAMTVNPLPPAPPTISSFSPTSGAVGTSVVITGTNFSGASAVSFNNTNSTFTINSATQITATVPSGASTGLIRVTTSGGTATSSTNFTVNTPPPTPPTISSFSPTSGAIGVSVIITGANFTGATAVRFNTTNATYTVNSATQITATVPSGASTGTISVTTAGGTATSSTSFSVTTSGGSTPSTMPIIPNIDSAMKARLRTILQAGQAMGNRPGVFAKIGDSITESGSFLWDVGCGWEDLGTNTSLASTLTYFRATTVPGSQSGCGMSNSFNRAGMCAVMGWSADTANANTSACAAPYNTYLKCELKTIMPSIAIIMYGTNDLERYNDVNAFRTQMNKIITDTINQGVIPVLSTIPPRLDSATMGSRVLAYNQAIIDMAQTQQIPLLNYWRTSLDPNIINQGVSTDGVHPNILNGADGAVWTTAGLRYGYNQRNLTATQTLEKIMRIIINDGAPDGGATPSVVLSSTPTSQNVVVGSSTTYTINMSRNNFTGGVTLSATGLPANTSASFSPAGANTGNNATLTVTTNANTPTGSNTLTVSGVASGLTINPITVGMTVTPPAPTIASFTPTSGPVGTSVVLTGTNFTGATVVSFNNTNSTFTVNSATQITATVPSAASTGLVRVTTAGGTATSSSNFTVTNPSVNLSITPASNTLIAGASGTYTLSINRTDFSGNVDLSISGLPSGATASFSPDPTTGNSSVLTINTTTNTVTGSSTLTISATASGITISPVTTTLIVNAPVPTISSFSPASGSVGTSVIITGANLMNTSSVKFNTTSATFIIDSTTQITTTVPSGASTGVISITTAGGAAISSSNFIVTLPSVGLSMTPSSNTIMAGESATYNIAINRTDFTGDVTLGVSGLPNEATASFNPTGTNSGNSATLTIDTTTNTPISSSTLTVSATASGITIAPVTASLIINHPVPTISSFSPASGTVGTSVVITGTNLSNASSVKFNDVGAVFIVDSSTQITAVVPSGATTGVISVSTLGGTATSSTPFTVTSPSVSLSITPASHSITTGESATYNIAINRTDFTGDVTLGVSGLPSGITTSFNPSGANSGASATLTLDTTASTSTGSRTLTISGTASGITIAPVTATLTINHPVPTISSFSPASGEAGTSVVITGTNLSDVTSVEFNTTSATFTIDSDSQITATVPANATTGPIHVTSAGGMATSSTNFLITTSGGNTPDNMPITPNIDSAMKARLKAIFLAGQSAGNRSGVFAKIGDSATASGAFLSDVGCSSETLDSDTNHLSTVINYFRTTSVTGGGSWCGIPNSFNRSTVSADEGWSTHGALGAISSASCPAPYNTALKCELYLTKPSIAVIMYGTYDLENYNDLTSFQNNLNQIIMDTINAGVIPVLSTIPPRLDNTTFGSRVAAYNQMIIDVAQAQQIPVMNFWKALQDPNMLNQGMDSDGLHLTSYPSSDASNLTPSGLRYGYNQRNLRVLEALEKVLNVVIHDGMPDGGTPTVSVSLSATPTSQTVLMGASTTYTININRTNFTDGVTLGVNGLPTGATATFSPADENTENSSTLTIDTTANTPGGSSTLTVTGSAEGITISPLTLNLTVTVPPPTITSFTPTSGGLAKSVTITGTNFTGATDVKFNTTSAIFTVDSATQITTTVPVGASTGKISVTTSGGTATSVSNFSVLASSVTLSVSPLSRTVTAGKSTTYTITLTRRNFTGGITLGVAGLGDGVSASFNPAGVNTTNKSIMTLSSTLAAATGAKTLTINGTAIGLTITPITVTLTVNEDKADADADGLGNSKEAILGTDPNNADTDGDSMIDSNEVAGNTDPLDSTSSSAYLFKDDFNDGDTVGWNNSGANTVNWNVNNGALTSNPIATGYSFFAPVDLDVSAVPKIAVSYDVTFSTDSDGWGGLWFKGIHIDINANRSGVRDGSFEGYSGTYQWYSGMSKGVKHHVLLLVRKASPYHLADLYIDAKLIFKNEPIEVSAFPNTTIGFSSNNEFGKMTCDNLAIYPNPDPLLFPFNDNFDEQEYGLWVASGSSTMTWEFSNGELKSNITSNGYAYLKHALLDISNKDVIMEFDINPQTWGGVSFRGVNCDLNGTRIGWRDSSTQWYPRMTAGTKHHVILMIQKSTPYNLSHLYVDGSLVFSNEPIEVNSFPDKTLGFMSNYNPGSNLYDNATFIAVDPGNNFAPILNPVGNKSVAANASLTFQVQAFDPNNDTLTYTATNLPSGANLDFNTGTFTWTPLESDQGIHTITIESSDGSLIDTETINLVVS